MSEVITPRPQDKHGKDLEPLDLVILGDIPQHYYADADDRSARVLRNYSGRYGLITYAMRERYYHGNKAHPGWVSGDASAVYVVSRAINDDHVSSYDFWLPPTSLSKIPFNFLIMSVFADYPWEITDGAESTDFVVAGTEQFNLIKKILDAPYEVLAKAHDVAMGVLTENA